MTTAWTAQRMCGPHQGLEHHRRKWSSAHGKTRYSPFIKKKTIAAFRHDFLLILIVRLRRFQWRNFNEKCPERIIVMRERNICLRSQNSLHSYTKQMLSLSRSDIRPTCARSNLILSPGFNVARSATWSVGNGHPPAEK